MRQKTGRVTISNPRSNTGEDHVKFQVENHRHEFLFAVKIAHREFSRGLLGLGARPCTIEIADEDEKEAPENPPTPGPQAGDGASGPEEGS